MHLGKLTSSFWTNGVWLTDLGLTRDNWLVSKQWPWCFLQRCDQHLIKLFGPWSSLETRPEASRMNFSTLQLNICHLSPAGAGRQTADAAAPPPAPQGAATQVPERHPFYFESFTRGFGRGASVWEKKSNQSRRVKLASRRLFRCFALQQVSWAKCFSRV